jgi:hypothetical protein
MFDIDEFDREENTDECDDDVEGDKSPPSIDKKLEYCDDDRPSSNFVVNRLDSISSVRCRCSTLHVCPCESNSTSLLTVSNVFIGRVMILFDLLVDGPRLGL